MKKKQKSRRDKRYQRKYTKKQLQALSKNLEQQITENVGIKILKSLDGI